MHVKPLEFRNDFIRDPRLFVCIEYQSSNESKSKHNMKVRFMEPRLDNSVHLPNLEYNEKAWL